MRHFSYCDLETAPDQDKRIHVGYKQNLRPILACDHFSVRRYDRQKNYAFF